MSVLPSIRSIPGAAGVVDPVAGHNFTVMLIELPLESGGAADELHAGLQSLTLAAETIALAGFSECTGLDASMQPFEWKAGGENIRRFAQPLTYGNITLKRGVALSDDLWNWQRSFAEGRGHRRDGVVVLQDDEQIPRRMWVFQRGLPVHWTGPALNATSNQMAIEQLEIAHEGIVGLSIGESGFSI